MKKDKTEIIRYHLDPSFYKIHKDGSVRSDFGLDNSNELIQGGFGLYSTVNLKANIGPIKTQYYRIALTRSGTANIDLGLEAFHPVRNTVVFGYPGQVFSLYDKSDDFFAYYLLFKEEFMAESLLLNDNREQYPFLSYSGAHSFQLNDAEAIEIEHIILKINGEIKNRKADIGRITQLYIQLIFVYANRSYERQQLAKQESGVNANALFRRFVKLVGRHFLRLRKVSDYADLLHVSADHLNRAIKSQSEKTAHELIDEMILREAKAYLLHTEYSNAEIAYQLDFSDPSHFNKFFKKQMNCTPLQFRGRS